MSKSRSIIPALLPRALTALAVSVLGMAGSALAAPVATYAEIGDAGQTQGTAQSALAGGAVLSDIFGSLGSETDVDLFVVNITSFAAFSATTVNSGTDSLLDTQIFLLTLSGQAVCLNDNDVADPSFFRSTLGAGQCSSAGGPGQYLLGISSGFFDAVDGNNDLLFAADPTTNAVRGAASTFGLAGFVDNGVFPGNFGSYDIQLTGVTALPEPTSMLLIAGALAGCGWSSTRRQRPTAKSAA